MDYKLRPWEPADLESLVKHANNRNIARFLTNRFPFPYTPQDGMKFINMAGMDENKLFFAIEIQGEAAGGIGIHRLQDIYRKNAELGYWLSETYWGKGIMTLAVREMTQYAFNQLDINRIFARPFGNNLPSQRVLEKAGFTLEASFKGTLLKEGEILDELVYAIRRKK